jgi:hypothetical protein
MGGAVTKAKISGGAVEAEEIIAGIIRTWKHLVHGELDAALKEFGSVTRASAQMLVSWTGQFSIINDIFEIIETLVYGKERARDRRWWKDHRKKLGLSKA